MPDESPDSAPRRLNCVDMSHWGGPLGDANAAALWDAGVRNIKIGDGNSAPGAAGMFARQQAETWLRVNGPRGGTVDAYVYLYFAGDAVQQVGQALRTLDGIAIRRWWLDAEDVDSPALSAADRVEFLHSCLAVLGGRPAGIYTAHWWWPDKMADMTEFSHLPLWNSWYDNDPNESGLPYGGWQHSAVEQYAGTTTVGGVSVDLDFDATLDQAQDKQLKKNEEMTMEDRARLDRLERIVAGWGFTSDEGAALTGEAAIAYIDQHQRSMYQGLLNTENDLAGHVAGPSSHQPVPTREGVRAAELATGGAA